MVRKEALFRKRVLLLSCAAAALMLFALLVPLRPAPAEAAGELVSLHDAHRAELASALPVRTRETVAMQMSSVGEEDAVYFYIWLDSRDVEPFTLKLENGGLSQCYYYDDGNETCRIEFHVKQEKNT